MASKKISFHQKQLVFIASKQGKPVDKLEADDIKAFIRLAYPDFPFDATAGAPKRVSELVTKTLDN